jgi:thiamine-phosphate diphosphorylase
MAVNTPVAPLLYVIGDRGAFKNDRAWLDALLKVAESLLTHENVALQIRVKGSCSDNRFRRMQQARLRLDDAINSGLRVFLNGTVTQAERLNFKSVHLKEELLDKTIHNPENLEIATSTHSIESIKKSADIGAAFCVFGPVFVPKSKKAEPLGVDTLKSAIQQTNLDVVALGGITRERVAPCLEAGAKGVACISSVMRSPNPNKSILQLLNAAQPQ